MALSQLQIHQVHLKQDVFMYLNKNPNNIIKAKVCKYEWIFVAFDFNETLQ